MKKMLFVLSVCFGLAGLVFFFGFDELAVIKADVLSPSDLQTSIQVKSDTKDGAMYVSDSRVSPDDFAAQSKSYKYRVDKAGILVPVQ